VRSRISIFMAESPSRASHGGETILSSPRPKNNMGVSVDDILDSGVGESSGFRFHGEGRRVAKFPQPVAPGESALSNARRDVQQKRGSTLVT